MIVLVIVLVSLLLSACGQKENPSLWDINDPTFLPLREVDYEMMIQPISKDMVPANPEANHDTIFYYVAEYKIANDPNVYLAVGQIGRFELVGEVTVIRERYFWIFQSVIHPGIINPVEYDAQALMTRLCQKTERVTGTLANCEYISLNLTIKPLP